MCPRVFAAAGLIMVLSAPAQAQIEITGNIGWTVSNGISGGPVDAPDGNRYDRIEPAESASFAVTLGYLARSGAELGFEWGRQLSELQVRGTATTTVGDMNVDNYHGYLAWNFGESDAAVRPFVMVGLGATSYGRVEFNVGGTARSTAATTRFSTTWGTGVKMYAGPNRNIGFRAALRWTPTLAPGLGTRLDPYITSDAAGWWCDPFWGCYVVGDSKYSHQFEVSGGIVLRFGS